MSVPTRIRAALSAFNAPIKARRFDAPMKARRFDAPMKARRFDAAGAGRRSESLPSFGRTAVEAHAAAPVIRARARYMAANNSHAANGVRALTAGLVGAGIKTESQHPDPNTRSELGSAFSAWAQAPDAEGRTNLAGLQTAIARALVIDGEIYVALENGPDGLPRLRLIPAELIDEADNRELPNGGKVWAGVEHDAANRRVAYHVLAGDPSDVFATSGPSQRIPAEAMLHIMEPLGPGQVRGVSWFAPVLMLLSELDGLEDALRVGFKVAAMHAGFLVDMNGSGDMPFDGEQSGSVLETGLEPGTLRYLPSGYDVKFSTPQQAQQSAEFVSHQLRAIAAGLGIPAHLLSGDLREANYGSLRAGTISFRQRLEQVQFGTLAPQLLTPVYERVVSALILSGRVAAPDFESNPAAYFACEHYPPPIPWLDPQKDVAAVKGAIDAGLMSRRQAVAERGYSIETLDEERAADAQREAALGLKPDAPATDEKEPEDV